MEFKLQFKMDNESFKHCPEEEIARTLDYVTNDVFFKCLYNDKVCGSIIDVNGNKIGTWEIN